jgi:uncharacterized protein (DUF433 family)
VIYVLLHIVRSGENINKIADNYQCEVSDITSNNLHIIDFKKLMPGTKLRIPFLTKEIIETLEETESFISDYYPTLKQKNVQKTQVETDVNKLEKESEITVLKEENMPIEEEKKPVVEVEKRVIKQPLYNGGYYGNVIPNYPSNRIKKI